MTLKKQFISILPLAIIVLGLLSYNFMNAQWTGPSATAPGANTAAPINEGTAPQTKNGVLGANNLAVFGSSTFSGRPNIQGTGPTITFTDTDHRDFWTHVNSNIFYILADRNSDGTWTGENPWPMELFAGSLPADDYVKFANSVHAVEYCDETGNNCFDPAQAVTSRVCPATQYVRGINADGSLVCATTTTAPPTTCTTNTKTVSSCNTSSPSSISCGTGWSKSGGVTYTGISCSTNGIRYTQNCIQTVCS
jgi:hypothetical protein